MPSPAMPFVNPTRADPRRGFTDAHGGGLGSATVARGASGASPNGGAPFHSLMSRSMIFARPFWVPSQSRNAA